MLSPTTTPLPPQQNENLSATNTVTPLSLTITPPPPLQKGNLSCDVINDKLYFKFELPFTFKRNPSNKFSLFQCGNFNKEKKLPPTKYINNYGRAISALVGAYDSIVLLRPLCVQIERDGKRTMQMEDFNVKSTQQPVGRAWNIFDQFDCFDRQQEQGSRPGGKSQQSSVRHLGVETNCTNMTVVWVNDKFDEFWFIRKQRVLIVERMAIKATAKTKASTVNINKPNKKQQQQQQRQQQRRKKQQKQQKLKKKIMKKHQQQQQQQQHRRHYYHEQEINFEGTTNTENHRYELGDLKPNTEYRVCVVTEYGKPNGSRRKCSTVYNFCWHRSGLEKEFRPFSSTKQGDQSFWIKITTIISGVTICAFVSVFLLVVGRRRLCGCYSKGKVFSLYIE